MADLGDARRGQSTVEYATFVCVFVAALIMMATYIRRSMQANLKTVEDQINTSAIRTPSGGGDGGGGDGGGGDDGGSEN